LLTHLFLFGLDVVGNKPCLSYAVLSNDTDLDRKQLILTFQKVHYSHPGRIILLGQSQCNLSASQVYSRCDASCLPGIQLGIDEAGVALRLDDVNREWGIVLCL
jgi:hypothetical protein